MKVAIAGYPLLSERQWRLCAEFERQDVDTHILVPEHWKDNPPADQPQNDSSFTVHRHRVIAEGSHSGYLCPGMAATLTSLRPDVVITHGEPWQLFVGSIEIMCEVLSIPHVVFTWENLNRIPSRWSQRFFERVFLPRLDHVIAGSDEAADRVRGRGFEGSVTVAPQTGVNTEQFSPIEVSPEHRTSFGINKNSPVVLYAGRFAPEKGIDALLDTVPDVVVDHPDVTYLLVGHGEYENHIAERIASENLDAHVTLIDERQPYSEMPAVYNLASVFAYPSETTNYWAEQFGFAVTEAMSCGVPVVTTDCGALPYVVGEGGVVCDEGDTTSLAAALSDLLADDSRRSKMGDRARERVVTTFSVEVVATTHLEVARAAIDEA